ncbi:hypothetical protein TSAR_003369 [Trichomalopsis sarcophagae]|uniref:Uncharacterized protein n=1 Tax=Trichomalopsis sarcophagae TaxID=543379 RepID=A0A232ED88_9HYME|nr:hypothetical protein TSAR_003369 [Trichomalopsis sarcophagae]
MTALPPEAAAAPVVAATAAGVVVVSVIYIATVVCIVRKVRIAVTSNVYTAIMIASRVALEKTIIMGIQGPVPMAGSSDLIGVTINSENFAHGSAATYVPLGAGRKKSFGINVLGQRSLISIIRNSDNLCLPRALVVDEAFVNLKEEATDTTKKAWTIYVTVVVLYKRSAR